VPGRLPQILSLIVGICEILLACRVIRSIGRPPGIAPAGGVGESGAPPTAPAACSANFAATGKRIRAHLVARGLDRFGRIWAHRGSWFYGAMAATFILGATFLFLEVREFADLVARGAGPTRSAFLSAFFTLVGCHDLHVTAGLLWLLTMMAQVFAKGYRADILRRILCFGLFWHTLDIIWVALFTVVYLMGAST
jgi:Cytochrome c oxidase subunit III